MKGSPWCLPFWKAYDTAPPALPRVRRSILQPHPWTPWICSILDFCKVTVRSDHNAHMRFLLLIDPFGTKCFDSQIQSRILTNQIGRNAHSALRDNMTILVCLSRKPSNIVNKRVAPNPPPKKRSTNNNRSHCNGLSQSGAVEICHLAELVARLFFPSFFWPFGSADFTGSSLLVGT